MSVFVFRFCFSFLFSFLLLFVYAGGYSCVDVGWGLSDVFDCGGVLGHRLVECFSLFPCFAGCFVQLFLEGLYGVVCCRADYVQLVE